MGALRGSGAQHVLPPAGCSEPSGFRRDQPVAAPTHRRKVVVPQLGVLVDELAQPEHRHLAGDQGPLVIEEVAGAAVASGPGVVEGPGGDGVRVGPLPGQVAVEAPMGATGSLDVKQQQRHGDGGEGEAGEVEEPTAHGVSEDAGYVRSRRGDAPPEPRGDQLAEARSGVRCRAVDGVGLRRSCRTWDHASNKGHAIGFGIVSNTMARISTAISIRSTSSLEKPKSARVAQVVACTKPENWGIGSAK